MHDLNVRDVVPPVSRAVRRPRCSRGVQRLPDSPVANGVEMDLESARVDRRDGFLQLACDKEARAGTIRFVPVPIEIRAKHRGGEVLAHPVLHDLDAGGMEPSGAADPLPPLNEPVELADTPAARPPPRSSYSC